MLGRLTLFKKIFLTYLAINLVLVGSLAVVISFLSKDFIYQGRRQIMLDAAQLGAQLAQKREAGVLNPTAMDEQLADIASLAVSSIYILPKESFIPKGQNTASELAAVLPAIQRILTGEQIVVPSVRLSAAATDVMLAGVPYFQGNQVQGAVLVFTPVAGLRERLQELYLIIWSTAGIAMIFATAATFALSRKITQPLSQLTADAARVAAGDFSYPLQQTKLQDEVGNLYKSYQKMKTELGKTEELRQAVIAGVAHDLRSPLTSIRGFINAVLDGTIEAQQRNKYLQIAADEAQRLVVMSEKTLQAAQLQSGVLKSQPQVFFARDLLEEVVLAVRFGLENAEQNVSIDCSHVAVLADMDQIRQILINLMENAVKYAGVGAAISLEAKADGEWVKFFVSDNGPGISPAFRPHLFDKYSQADAARSPGRTGVGLGLWIARDLAHLNGGELELREQVPGASFELCLPKAK